MHNSEHINQAINQAILAFEQIPFGSFSISAPYARNMAGFRLQELLQDPERSRIYDAMKDGSFLLAAGVGKNSADQIKQFAEDYFTQDFPGSTHRTPNGVLGMLRRHCVGVDCSGFVFHVLASVANSLNRPEIIDQLGWSDNRKTVFQASTKVLAQAPHITVSEWDQIQPGDLFFQVNSTQGYHHVGIVVQRDGLLWLSQSSVSTPHDGVTTYPLQDFSEGSVFLNLIPCTIGESWSDSSERNEVVIHRLQTLTN
jgi:hypothetical protein